MADTTISGLTLGVPPVGAVLPYSDGTITRKTTTDNILANAGNVGLGTTSPTSKLTVSGSIYSSGQGRFAGWYTGGDGAGLATEIGTSGGQGYLYAFNRTASTYAPINIATGNAGLQINTNGVINATGTLNLAGPYKGTIQRGSYGSLTIGGSNNGYSGIDFTDAAATFMINNSDGLCGVYKNNNSWAWYFDGSGNLITGSVPWNSITGRPKIAWARFNGSGAIQAGSSGVNSVTNNPSGLGTNIYRINVTGAGFSNANYSVTGMTRFNNYTNSMQLYTGTGENTTYNPTSTVFYVSTNNDQGGGINTHTNYIQVIGT